MAYGLIISLVLHAALILVALFTIERTPPLVVPEQQVAEISILADDGITRQRQGEENAKTLEAAGKEGQAKEPPKQEPVKPPPPPPPQAAAPPPPPPPDPPKADPIAEKIASAADVAPPKAPTVDDQKMLDDKLAEDAEIAAETKRAADAKAKAKAEADAKAKAEAERKKKLAEEQRKKLAEEKKKADAKKLADAKKAAEAKKSLTDIVSSALDKSPDSTAQPKALLNKAPPKPAALAGNANAASPNAGAVAGTKSGTDTQLTATKIQLINSIMKNNVQRCWNINSGMEGAAKLIVKVEFKLAQDGRLVGDPKVISPGSGPQFDDAANSARRALVECQPYTNLPPELYAGGWDYMALTFDPSKMF